MLLLEFKGSVFCSESWLCDMTLSLWKSSHWQLVPGMVPAYYIYPGQRWRFPEHPVLILLVWIVHIKWFLKWDTYSWLVPSIFSAPFCVSIHILKMHMHEQIHTDIQLPSDRIPGKMLLNTFVMELDNGTELLIYWWYKTWRNDWYIQKGGLPSDLRNVLTGNSMGSTKGNAKKFTPHVIIGAV